MSTPTFAADTAGDKGSDEIYVYEKIYSSELSKSEIISNSNAYLAEMFSSAKSEIKLKDMDLGRIIGNVTLMNSNAGFFDAFKGIVGKLVIDAKDGRYRVTMSNIEAVDGNGDVAAFGKLEGANRYRIEPMAKSVLDDFSYELETYLKNAKASSDW